MGVHDFPVPVLPCAALGRPYALLSVDPLLRGSLEVSLDAEAKLELLTVRAGRDGFDVWNTVGVSGGNPATITLDGRVRSLVVATTSDSGCLQRSGTGLSRFELRAKMVAP